MEQLWVAQLWVSDRTAEKIRHKHAIEPNEVTEAVACREGLQWVLDHDEGRGERVIVETRIRGRPARVVLYDAHHPLADVWHLGSVYFV